MHWTPARLVAHQTSNLRADDLLGTGTISAPGPEGAGSLLKMTRGGREPLGQSSREVRRLLEDGD